MVNSFLRSNWKIVIKDSQKQKNIYLISKIRIFIRISKNIYLYLRIYPLKDTPNFHHWLKDILVKPRMCKSVISQTGSSPGTALGLEWGLQSLTGALGSPMPPHLRAPPWRWGWAFQHPVRSACGSHRQGLQKHPENGGMKPPFFFHSSKVRKFQVRVSL